MQVPACFVALAVAWSCRAPRLGRVRRFKGLQKVLACSIRFAGTAISQQAPARGAKLGKCHVLLFAATLRTGCCPVTASPAAHLQTLTMTPPRAHFEAMARHRSVPAHAAAAAPAARGRTPVSSLSLSHHCGARRHGPHGAICAACRASEARKHIPENLKLVSLFGWTLGGVYLARYRDSPAGQFDELVVLAGLVWNPPTSCAWAQRVYVNSRSARNHGLKAVGLPSRLATFTQAGAPADAAAGGRRRPWWNAPYAPHAGGAAGHALVVHNAERGRRGKRGAVAELELPPQQTGWAPSIPMALPNFSGNTPDHPGLLHYTCQMRSRVRLLPRARIRAVGAREEESGHEDVSSVVRGRPVVCIEFAGMEMHVPEPAPLESRSRKRSGLHEHDAAALSI